MVSGQGNDEEGTNLLNIITWVEGAVLEYEPRNVAKTPGKLLTTYRHAGEGGRCRYEGKSYVGISMRKMFEGRQCKEGC